MGKAAAAGVPPDQISGLQFWLDASKITGKVDGDPISQWDDSSGNTRHATQATAAAQPVYKAGANGIGGKPAVRFDGVDDFLASSQTSSFRPLTLVWVALFDNFTDWRCPVGNGGGAGGRVLRPDKDGQANARKSQFLNSQTALIATETTALPLATGVMESVTYDDTGNFAFYRNGAANGSGVNNVALTAGRTTRIGASHVSGPVELMAGLIAEVVEYHRILTASELSDLHAHLKAKYGL